MTTDKRALRSLVRAFYDKTKKEFLEAAAQPPLHEVFQKINAGEAHQLEWIPVLVRGIRERDECIDELREELHKAKKRRRR